MTTIALVGCAHIHTPGFVRRLQARHDVKTVAVWDKNPARAEGCAAQLGAPLTTDLDSIWDDSSIEGVIICSETDRHEAMVSAAGRGGQASVRGEAAGHGRRGRIPHGRRDRTGGASCSRPATSSAASRRINASGS